MSASVLYDAPGPRARIRNLVVGAVAVLVLVALGYFVYSRLDGAGQFTAKLWEPFEYTEIQRRIGEGVLATLKVFALAVVLSLALGALLAAGRLSDHAPVRWAATAVVEFFRAIPLLIMIFALYVGVFTNYPLWALVIGLTLYNSSVQAEIFRAGIRAVPRGQGEAAYAIGLRKTQVMAFVLVPQGVRAMLPSIISQLVVTLKDTALGYIITYEELLFVGRQIAQNGAGYPYIPMVMVIAPIYILMCMALSWLSNWIERRGRRRRKGALPAAPEAEEAVAVAE